MNNEEAQAEIDRFNASMRAEGLAIEARWRTDTMMSPLEVVSGWMHLYAKPQTVEELRATLRARRARIQERRGDYVRHGVATEWAYP